MLALGEVTNAEVDQLLAAPIRMSKFGRIWDEDRKVVILHDTTKMRAIRDVQLRAHVLGKDVGAGVYAEFEVNSTSFHLIAAHWPSHMVPSEAQRQNCGQHLQAWVRELRQSQGATPVVVMGDFNDEPFASSLTSGLQGTRDRNAARGNADLLYNPFWRHLGERHLIEDEPPFLGAGT